MNLKSLYTTVTLNIKETHVNEIYYSHLNHFVHSSGFSF